MTAGVRPCLQHALHCGNNGSAEMLERRSSAEAQLCCDEAVWASWGTNSMVELVVGSHSETLVCAGSR
jgi:hypothetical protein